MTVGADKGYDTTQYEWRRDEGKRLEIAREVVGAKLWNSVAVLRDYGMNYGMGLVKEEVEGLRRASEAAVGAERGLNPKSETRS